MNYKRLLSIAIIILLNFVFLWNGLLFKYLADESIPVECKVWDKLKDTCVELDNGIKEFYIPLKMPKRDYKFCTVFWADWGEKANSTKCTIQNGIMKITIPTVKLIQNVRPYPDSVVNIKAIAYIDENDKIYEVDSASYYVYIIKNDKTKIK